MKASARVGGAGGVAAAPTILVVEDDWLVADCLRIALEGFGYAVCGPAATAEEAVRLARAERPSAVLMDVRLSGVSDGIHAGSEILADRLVPIVYVTATSDSALHRRIEEQNPAAVLTKPVDREQLRAILARVCPLA